MAHESEAGLSRIHPVDLDGYELWRLRKDLRKFLFEFERDGGPVGGTPADCMDHDPPGGGDWGPSPRRG